MQSTVTDEEVLRTSEVFDTEGNPVTFQIEYLKSGAKFKTVYTRDQEKGIRTGISYREDGSIKSKVIYRYDATGFLIEQTSLNGEGDFQFKWIFTRSPETHTETAIVYLADGSIYRKSVSVYDDQGNLISIDGFIGLDRLDYRALSRYDIEGNNTLSLIYNADGTLDQRRVYEHDAYGNVTDESSYNGDGTLRDRRRYRYEYDAMGNWIKKSEFEWVTDAESGQFIETNQTKRTITYFEEE